MYYMKQLIIFIYDNRLEINMSKVKSAKKMNISEGRNKISVRC